MALLSNLQYSESLLGLTEYTEDLETGNLRRRQGDTDTLKPKTVTKRRRQY